MVDNRDLMESIWSNLNHQVIQHVFEIKPYFWVFTMRAKNHGMLLLNFQNEHPTFSIQNKIDLPTLLHFSEPGLTEKLKGFQIENINILSDNSIILSLKQDNQIMVIRIQLAPYSPRFLISKGDEIIYDSILGWQPKRAIKSKPSILVLDESMDLDWMIRYSYSLSYLQIIKKVWIRKQKRQEALEADLQIHIQSLGYQSIAEAILAEPNQPWHHYPNPNHLPVPQKNFKTNFSGSNELFERYKKAKKGISLTQTQLKLNQGFIEALSPFTKMIPPLNHQDLGSLKTFLERQQILSAHEDKPTEVQHQSPYYVEYKGTRISFGKNAKQNHHLTFSLAKKNDIFMHIDGKPGSHLVIHHSHFDHDLIIIGAQLVLALAKQIAGTVTYAKVGSLKQTKTIGLVMIKDAKTIKANADFEYMHRLLEGAKRY